MSDIKQIAVILHEAAAFDPETRGVFAQHLPSLQSAQAGEIVGLIQPVRAKKQNLIDFCVSEFLVKADPVCAYHLQATPYRDMPLQSRIKASNLAMTLQTDSLYLEALAERAMHLHTQSTTADANVILIVLQNAVILFPEYLEGATHHLLGRDEELNAQNISELIQIVVPPFQSAYDAMRHWPSIQDTMDFLNSYLVIDDRDTNREWQLTARRQE